MYLFVVISAARIICLEASLGIIKFLVLSTSFGMVRHKSPDGDFNLKSAIATTPASPNQVLE